MRTMRLRRGRFGGRGGLELIERDLHRDRMVGGR